MAPSVTVSSALLSRLMAAAAASPVAEICGLLFGCADAILGAAPCRNVAPDPARAFELDPVQLIAAHRAQRAGGPVILGHYHSHPKGAAIPSAADRAAAAPDGTLWLIVTAHEARLWRAVASAKGVDLAPVKMAIAPPCTGRDASS